MNRPTLSHTLTSEEFTRWYWLKEELVSFCREHGISSTGLKRELELRICEHLAGQAVASSPPKKTRSGKMPSEFTLDTLIGTGWRCGPSLGGFFKRELGSGFHFNAAMRDFIHNGQGRTLAEAAMCYQMSVRPGRAKSEIPPQLEYNQHFRDYFHEHPGALRDDAIAAWWAKRGKRKERTSAEF